MLPDRLSYPEIVGHAGGDVAAQLLYDGTVRGLADRLAELANRLELGPLWPADITPALLTDRFKWQNLAPEYDRGFAEAASRR